MEYSDSRRIKEIRDNTAKMADAFTRIADALERLADCKTESNSEKPNNSTISKMEQVEDEPQTCEECEHWNDTEDGCADRHGCKDEPGTDCDKGLQLFADILFDKEKSEQFLKECKALGIEPQTKRSE